MIDFLIGEIVNMKENLVSMDVNGVGYRVNVPTSVTGTVRAGDKNVTIHTSLIATDGNLNLYGFMTPEERDVFEMLITVSGIGPKAGIKMLSLQKERLLEAIAAEDVAVLTTIQGIGPKTAKRVVLELKDKIIELFGHATGGGFVFTAAGGETGVAASALQSLGYTASEVRSMLKAIPRDKLEVMSAQEIIKQCLKRRE
jgi:Holliday junction DNA helicase RuvA